MADAKALLDKMKAIKESDSFEQKRKNGTLNGAMIGAIGGFVFGYIKKYNLLGSVIIGALIGGMATHLLLPNTENDDTDESDDD